MMLYVFSSSDIEQRQYQQQRPVKEKNNEGLEGIPIHTSKKSQLRRRSGETLYNPKNFQNLAVNEYIDPPRRRGSPQEGNMQAR